MISHSNSFKTCAACGGNVLLIGAVVAVTAIAASAEHGHV